jgi:ArsR family transcriptional regulator
MNDKQLVKILKAIGNERRLAILKHLKTREMSVSQISKLIKLSFRSTSKHLMILSGAGLVEAKQDNLNRIYFISSDFPKQFSELLFSV